MDFLKKIISPVALKSEPAEPQAQPEPEKSTAPQERKPSLQASSRPLQHAEPQVELRVRTEPPPAEPRVNPEPRPKTTQNPEQGPAQQAVRASTTTLMAQAISPSDQPQAPVWAQVPTQMPSQPAALQRVYVQSLQTPTRVAPARLADRVSETGPPSTATAGIPPGVAGPTSYLSNVPGFWRKVWAMHPNRTTRRLRRLLLSWERLGAYISSPGSVQELTPAAETAFLRAKIDIARSVGYLKLLETTGGIAKEAGQKEAQFVELLERFPSLHSARSAGDAARRNLYYNWHLLYLFLHKMMGASPYEPRGKAGALWRQSDTVIPPGRTPSGGRRRTG